MSQLYHRLFVAHWALCARLGDARFLSFCPLVFVIVRGFPPALLSVLLSAKTGSSGCETASYAACHSCRACLYSHSMSVVGSRPQAASRYFWPLKSYYLCFFVSLPGLVYFVQVSFSFALLQ